MCQVFSTFFLWIYFYFKKMDRIFKISSNLRFIRVLVLCSTFFFTFIEFLFLGHSFQDHSNYRNRCLYALTEVWWKWNWKINCFTLIIIIITKSYLKIKNSPPPKKKKTTNDKKCICPFLVILLDQILMKGSLICKFNAYFKFIVYLRLSYLYK